MTKNRWDKFKKNFSKKFYRFLMIFAAEQDFINKHRRKKQCNQGTRPLWKWSAKNSEK